MSETQHPFDDGLTLQQRAEYACILIELRKALRAQHPKGPGGAAFCICGACGGGSKACGAFAILQTALHHWPENARNDLADLMG